MSDIYIYFLMELLHGSNKYKMNTAGTLMPARTRVFIFQISCTEEDVIEVFGK